MRKTMLAWMTALALSGLTGLFGADGPKPAPPSPGLDKMGKAEGEASRLYVLKPNDVVMIHVYQEDDLTTQARVARDGSITMPLLGTLIIGSNTVEQANKTIRDLLAKDFLVNPQVSLTILEYAKRRFTVLGQVQRPGTYEMPNEESLNLLQAIAMAGGYTRIGNPSKVTLQRIVNGVKKTLILNAKSMAEDKKSKPVEVLPEDTITVGEKWI